MITLDDDIQRKWPFHGMSGKTEPKQKHLAEKL